MQQQLEKLKGINSVIIDNDIENDSTVVSHEYQYNHNNHGNILILLQKYKELMRQQEESTLSGKKVTTRKIFSVNYQEIK